MALKNALSHFWYSVVRLLNKLLRMFPGNIGNGIKSEAARKIIKKTSRIGIPLKVFPGTPSVSSVLIFNKHFCAFEEQNYKSRLGKSLLKIG